MHLWVYLLFEDILLAQSPEKSFGKWGHNLGLGEPSVDHIQTGQSDLMPRL